jgi:hypothetical protein
MNRRHETTLLSTDVKHSPVKTHTRQSIHSLTPKNRKGHQTTFDTIFSSSEKTCRVLLTTLPSKTFLSRFIFPEQNPVVRTTAKYTWTDQTNAQLKDMELSNQHRPRPVSLLPFNHNTLCFYQLHLVSFFLIFPSSGRVSACRFGKVGISTKKKKKKSNKIAGPFFRCCVVAAVILWSTDRALESLKLKKNESNGGKRPTILQKRELLLGLEEVVRWSVQPFPRRANNASPPPPPPTK